MFFRKAKVKPQNQQRPVTQRARLGLEQLEDRCVPSAAPTVDLTTAGASGRINGAFFQQLEQQPSGSGVLQSFVRLKAPGNSPLAQGYNTDARPLQFNENNSPVFTRSLPLASVPEVTYSGTKYREFLLDINQRSSNPVLSLDELRFFTADSGNLKGYNTTAKTLAGHPAVYDMGADNWVKLDARLSHGSGSSDMVLLVPSAAFSGGTYVYLYSKFGVHCTSNGGYEEWASGQAVPLPTVTISGTVTDTSGVTYTVTLTDTTTGATETIPLSATSSYAFTDLLPGDSYTVSIVTTGTVTPPSYTEVNLTVNVTAADFTITGGIMPE